MVWCGDRMVPRGRRVTEEEWRALTTREGDENLPRKTVTFRPSVKVRGVCAGRFQPQLA